MTEPEDAPPPAVAVSPTDQTSDRAQSDKNNADAATDRAANAQNAAAGQGEIMDILRTIRDEGRKIPVTNERLATSMDNYALAMVEYQERAKLAAEREHAAAHRGRVIIGTVIGGIAVVLAAVVVLLAFVLIGLHAAQDTRDRILSCTDLTGECAKQSQAQTVTIIQKLIDSNINIAACAPAGRGLPTATDRRAAIAACIAEIGG